MSDKFPIGLCTKEMDVLEEFEAILSAYGERVESIEIEQKRDGTEKRVIRLKSIESVSS